MKGNLLIGVVLIVLGAVMIGYGHFTYKTQEKVFEVGPLKATAERTNTVPLPTIIGWALLGGGVCVLVFGAVRPKS